MLIYRVRFPDVKSAVVFGTLLLATALSWQGFVWPHLQSFLDSKADYAESYPFLYTFIRNIIIFLAIPWVFGPPYTYLLLYARALDRKAGANKPIEKNQTREIGQEGTRELFSISIKALVVSMLVIAAAIYILFKVFYGK